MCLAGRGSQEETSGRNETSGCSPKTIEGSLSLLGHDARLKINEKNYANLSISSRIVLMSMHLS